MADGDGSGLILMNDAATMGLQLDLADLAKSGFTAWQNKDLSPHARLAQTGHLGPKAYLGAMVVEEGFKLANNLVEAQKISVQAKASIQLALIQFADQAAKNQAEFIKGVLAINQERTKAALATVEFMKQVHAAYEKANEKVLELGMKMADMDSEKDKTKILMIDKLINRELTLIENDQKWSERVMEIQQKIQEANAISPDYITITANANKEVYLQLLDTIKAVSAEQTKETQAVTETIKAGIEASKEVAKEHAKNQNGENVPKALGGEE